MRDYELRALRIRDFQRELRIPMRDYEGSFLAVAVLANELATPESDSQAQRGALTICVSTRYESQCGIMSSNVRN